MTSWRDVPGWFDFQDVYDQVVAEAPAKGARFVELGIASGRSTLYMAEQIRSSGKVIDFCAFDSWRFSEGRERQRTFREALKEARLTGHVNALEQDFIMASTLFDRGTLDFVFLDGGHELEHTRAELRVWLPLVKPGGVLAGHDYTKAWPGVVQAVDELLPGRIVRPPSSFFWRVPT